MIDILLCFLCKETTTIELRDISFDNFWLIFSLYRSPTSSSSLLSRHMSNAKLEAGEEIITNKCCSIMGTSYIFFVLFLLKPKDLFQLPHI